jgi:hypothetical protein
MFHSYHAILEMSIRKYHKKRHYPKCLDIIKRSLAIGI